MEQVAMPTFGASMDHGEFHTPVNTTTATTTNSATTTITTSSGNTRRSSIHSTNTEMTVEDANANANGKGTSHGTRRSSLTRTRRPTERALASHHGKHYNSTHHVENKSSMHSDVVVNRRKSSTSNDNTPTPTASNTSTTASHTVAATSASSSSSSSSSAPSSPSLMVPSKKLSMSGIQHSSNSSKAKSSDPLKSSSTWIPEPLPPIPPDAASYVQFDFSTMHPDDARDKVFVAIVRALVQLGNRPSSPKELASAIMRFHFAILGGSTPYATVSSRISQHFKRVAEARPPRLPVLGKHIDGRYSRKIHYYIAGVGRLPIIPSQSAGTSDVSEVGTPTSSLMDAGYDDMPAVSDQSPTTIDENTAMELSSSYGPTINSTRKRSRSRVGTHSQHRVSAQKRPRRPSSSAAMAAATMMMANNGSGTAVPGRPDEMPRWRRAAFCLSDGDDDGNDDDGYDHEGDEEADYFEDIELPHGLINHHYNVHSRHKSSSTFQTNRPGKQRRHQSLSQFVFDDEDMMQASSTRPGHLRRSASVSVISNASLNESLDGSGSSHKANTPITRPIDALSVLADVPYNTSRRPNEDIDIDDDEDNYDMDENDLFDDYDHLDEVDDEDDDDEDDEAEISDYADEMMNGLLDMDDTEMIEVDDATATTTATATISSTTATAATTNTATATLPMPISGKFNTVKAINVPASPNDQFVSSSTISHVQSMSSNQSMRNNYHMFGSSPQQSSSSYQRSRRRSSLAILGGQGSPSFSSLVDALSRASGELRGSPTVSALFGEEYIMTSSCGLDNTLLDSVIPPVVPPPPSPISFDAASVPLTDLRDPESMSAIELDRLFGGTTATTTATNSLSSSLRNSLILQDDGNNPSLSASSDTLVAKDNTNEDVNMAFESTSATTSIGNDKADTTSCIDGYNSNTDKDVVTTSIQDNTTTLGDTSSSASISTKSLSKQASSMTSSATSSASSIHTTQQRCSAQATKSSATTTMSTPTMSMSFAPTGPPLVVPAPRRSLSVIPVVTTSTSTSASSSGSSNNSDGSSSSANNNGNTTSGSSATTIMSSDIAHDKSASGAMSIRTATMRLPAPLTRPRPQLVRDLTRGLSGNIKRTLNARGDVKDSMNLSGMKTTSFTQHHTLSKALLSRKESSRDTMDVTSTTSVKEEESSPPVPFTQLLDPSIPIISTSRPTSPVIVIMAIEGTPFYVTVLGPVQGFSRDFRMMRRVDTGYVNASALLEAGGIETESERSIILSLEIGRMRVPQRESELFGTWIPLGRARALAATCSLQNRLGPFLNDNLATYFPSPLPVEDANPSLDTTSTANRPILAQTLSQRLAALGLDNSNNSSNISKNCTVKSSPESAPLVDNQQQQQQQQQQGCVDMDTTNGDNQGEQEDKSTVLTTNSDNTPLRIVQLQHPCHYLSSTNGSIHGGGGGNNNNKATWLPARSISTDGPNWLSWTRTASPFSLNTGPMLGGGDHSSSMMQIALNNSNSGNSSSNIGSNSGKGLVNTSGIDHSKSMSNATSLSLRRLQQKAQVASATSTISMLTPTTNASMIKSRNGTSSKIAAANTTSTGTAMTSTTNMTPSNMSSHVTTSPKRPRARREETIGGPLVRASSTPIIVGKRSNSASNISTIASTMAVAPHTTVAATTTTISSNTSTGKHTTEDEDDEELDVGGEDEDDDLR
ncbi:hypothetical protein BDF22DRAFT_741177 [Syncephalis plumigaleata]|nr:hypothetical protein BDF22DRAFT_741177 [Syncephalis plumigaleata]